MALEIFFGDFGVLWERRAVCGGEYGTEDGFAVAYFLAEKSAFAALHGMLAQARQGGNDQFWQCTISFRGFSMTKDWSAPFYSQVLFDSLRAFC